MGKVRLKELKALAQSYTARKGRSEAEIAVSRTPKPHRMGGAQGLTALWVIPI